MFKRVLALNGCHVAQVAQVGEIYDLGTGVRHVLLPSLLWIWLSL